MIRQNELMNVRCSERGSLLGIKIYSPSSECLIECVDIPEHSESLLLIDSGMFFRMVGGWLDFVYTYSGMLPSFV